MTVTGVVEVAVVGVIEMEVVVVAGGVADDAGDGYDDGVMDVGDAEGI